jgi:tetratricopeptide (TPR) repeat protein
MKVEPRAATACCCASVLVLAFVFASTAGGGCAKRRTQSAEAADAAPAVAAAALSVDLSKRPVTTSASIAWNNLDGEIAQQIEKDDPSPAARLRLVELLLMRAQILSSIADLERADAVARRVTAESPSKWQAPFASALACSALHRFGEASSALDRAEKAFAPRDRVKTARATIALAQGRYTEAGRHLPKTEELADSSDLETAAVLAARMQRRGEADRLFDRARERFNSVSPFPLAWMDYQRAVTLDATGEEDAARRYYEEAIEILPEYTHAAIHLAPRDPPDVAIRRLVKVQLRSDDPSVTAALAEAHRRAGHAEESRRLVAEARQRFRDAVETHPEAFADHAARFWLEAGAEPKLALELARRNADNRPTEEALDLRMAAAAAANDRREVCAAATALRDLPFTSVRVRRLASAASEGCEGEPAR